VLRATGDSDQQIAAVTTLVCICLSSSHYIGRPLDARPALDTFPAEVNRITNAFGVLFFESMGVMAGTSRLETQPIDVIVGKLMDRLRPNNNVAELIAPIGDGLREDTIEHSHATTGEHIETTIHEDPENRLATNRRLLSSGARSPIPQCHSSGELSRLSREPAAVRSGEAQIFSEDGSVLGVEPQILCR
jgi:hypothetical protein